MSKQLTSIIQLQNDKRLKSKKFIEYQSQLNGRIKSSNKDSRQYPHTKQYINSYATSPRNEYVDNKAYKNQFQGKILQEQITMKNLDTEYELQRSRIEDESNAQTFKKKYPYGKQNVKITNDILQKYSTKHYINQSEMLKKFQNDAKARKVHINPIKKIQNYYNQPSILSPPWYLQRYKKMSEPVTVRRESIKKRDSKLEQELTKLSRARSRYRQQKQKQFARQSSERRQLKNMENMLKNMKRQVAQNTSIVLSMGQQSNLYNHQKRLQFSLGQIRKLQNDEKQIGRRMPKRIVVPKIVYSNQFQAKRDFFGNRYSEDEMGLQRKSIPRSLQAHDQVRQIFDLNRNRLQVLSYDRYARNKFRSDR